MIGDYMSGMSMAMGGEPIIPIACMDSPEGTESDLQSEFIQTFERRRTQLVRVAMRITRCEEDAEDIVQDSILKALNNLSRFRREARMDTWLHTIVVNTARSWLRCQRGHTHVPLESDPQQQGDSVPLDLPHPGETPEEFCRRRELRTLLIAEMGKLDPMYSAPIQLCDLEERSYRDAAHVLHVKDGTIKARLFRGRSLLKRRLSRHARARTSRRFASSARPGHSPGVAAGDTRSRARRQGRRVAAVPLT